MTLPTLDRLPLGYFRHPSADLAAFQDRVGGVPVYVQKDELAAAEHPDDTLRSAAVEYAGANPPGVDGRAPIYESELR